MDEYIDHWYIHKTEHDYVDYFAEWWQQDLTDMVEKDYNHPCVVLYSTGNEVSGDCPKARHRPDQRDDRLPAWAGRFPPGDLRREHLFNF